jgi:hypothetical protein
MSVTRFDISGYDFDFDISGCDFDIAEDTEGEWVRYVDHAAALTAANARADAAEAALAAQIEADAGLRNRVATAIFDPGLTEGYKGDRTLTEWQVDAVMRAIANQPHDRTALERLIAKAEADALRKAAAVVEAYDRQDGGAAKAILAEIKGESRD